MAIWLELMVVLSVERPRYRSTPSSLQRRTTQKMSASVSVPERENMFSIFLCFTRFLL